MRQMFRVAKPLLQRSIYSCNNIKPSGALTTCTSRIIGYGTNFQQTRLCSSSTEDKGSQIYSGILSTQIRSVKIFSLSTSFAGIIGQPIILTQTANLGSIATGAVCALVGFFTFVTPLLLHIITKKYVITIHYNDKLDAYTATTISFFLRRQELQFKTSDVVVPDVPGMFTSFIVKGKSLFVEPHQFDNPDHYVKLMGYDKPMDFKLNLDAEEYKDNKKEK